MKLKTIVIATLVIIVVIVVALALRYRWFLRTLEKEDVEKRKNFKPMLSEKVPYEAYKRIVAKGPVKTEPVCKGIDFLELLLEPLDENNSNHIESNLANIDVGENIL